MQYVTTEKMSFDIVSGMKTSERLHRPLVIGRATRYVGDAHYTLKIWSLYSQTFYLVRNHGDEIRYTIYAKVVQEDANVRFLNPIGTGFMPRELKSHLEIKFRFPRQSLYMNLFPLAN